MISSALIPFSRFPSPVNPSFGGVVIFAARVLIDFGASGKVSWRTWVPRMKTTGEIPALAHPVASRVA